jgi:hypothetical protein
MDIEKLKQDKIEMEKTIGQLMKEFSEKWDYTGFHIRGVNVCFSMIKTEHSNEGVGYVRNVEVNVDLK